MQLLDEITSARPRPRARPIEHRLDAQRVLLRGNQDDLPPGAAPNRQSLASLQAELPAKRRRNDELAFRAQADDVPTTAHARKPITPYISLKLASGQ